MNFSWKGIEYVLVLNSLMSLSFTIVMMVLCIILGLISISTRRVWIL